MLCVRGGDVVEVWRDAPVSWLRERASQWALMRPKCARGADGCPLRTCTNDAVAVLRSMMTHITPLTRRMMGAGAPLEDAPKPETA